MLLAFRQSTPPGVLARPLTAEEALGVVDGWLTSRSAQVVHPTAHHLAVLTELLRAVGTAGNLTSDAHLAALAKEHRADIASFDADFDRFPGVRWRRPQAPSPS